MNANISSEQKFVSKINMILAKIQSEGTINRFVLCRMTNTTPRQYSSIHPYLAEAYPDKISFDEKTKNWTWVAKERNEVPKSLNEALVENG